MKRLRLAHIFFIIGQRPRENRGDRSGMRFGHMVIAGLFCALATVGAARAQGASLDDRIARLAEDLEQKVIAWRRDIHQHPELSNREFRTAKLVADHLRAVGFTNVETGVAHTGVVARLKGGKPGPAVALRADMDALPVTEQVDLPFASKVRAEYNGQEVGVMHACGHDAHTAILMGVAELLYAIRDELPGTVTFIFQPAEEGAPGDEKGGAKLMLEEGLFRGDGKPDAVFGLHVWPGEAGTISYRPRGTMAASDEFHVTIEGRQTHGSSPWLGIDPVTVAGQMLSAIQMIPSRQLDITVAPSVITVGKIAGGVRHNIIPDTVTMEGTIRTFDASVRERLLKRLEATVSHVAESAGATASLEVRPYSPVVFNDPDLTAWVLPSLEKAAGRDKVSERGLIMGAEDFAYYVEEVPGVFFFLGVNRQGVAPEKAAPNHSPLFYVNEDALVVGVRALSYAAADFLRSGGPAEARR